MCKLANCTSQEFSNVIKEFIDVSCVYTWALATEGYRHIKFSSSIFCTIILLVGSPD